MTYQHTYLPPASPAELLSIVISRYRYPTTVIIGQERESFANDLREGVESASCDDARGSSPDAKIVEPTPTPHRLLKATLIQTAVSRHIRLLFLPTVTHLRAVLATFSTTDSRLPAPPNHPQSNESPTLLVYGFIELHRDASEWSAQGISNSLAHLVEAATRNGFAAAVMEPKVLGWEEDYGRFPTNRIPILNGAAMTRRDGSMSGSTVEIGQVLQRWFRNQPLEDEEE